MPSTTNSPPPKEKLLAIHALVTALLSHYWVPADSVEARRLQIADWLEDLKEFDLDIIREATTWRREHEDRRPTPGAIRKLCIPEHNRRAQERALVAPGQLSEAEKYARSVGWASNAERRDAIARSEAKLGANRDNLADGKAIGNRWAYERGYPSLDAYAAANGLDYAGARAEVCRSIIAQAAEKRRMPLHPHQKMPERVKERLRAEQPYTTPDRAVHDVLAEMGISSEAVE